VIDAIECGNCKERYDFVWGVPFFGKYEKEDLLGLIEIAANADNYSENYVFDPDAFSQWEQLLNDYHVSVDRSAFLDAQKNRESIAPWLPHRYNEWLEIKALAHGMNIQGSQVLDVGAGLGFDSYRLLNAGGQVTSLEFSPILAREGRKNLPQARWIGGFSYLLPFADGSFDFVFANATLHHIRDIPTSMKEMLRVLKPGGWLLTTCDSYRADYTKEDMELSVFNENPDVLLGVNERIPRFSEFVQTLKTQGDNIEPFVFTHSLPTFLGDVNYLRSWRFDTDKKMLSQASGSIALKVQLKTPIDAKPVVQKSGLLKPGEFAQWLGTQVNAMAKLARLMPARLVNQPFPGQANTKFHLLNGWQAKEVGASFRQAYRCSRWYMKREPMHEVLHVEVMAPDSGLGPEASFNVLIDGEKVLSESLTRGIWTRLSIPLTNVLTDRKFAVELQLETIGEAFTDGVFRVRRLQFGVQEPFVPFSLSDIQEAGLAALLKFYLSERNSVSVLFYPSQESSFPVINLLRGNNIAIRAIVPEGQEVVFGCERGVSIESTYPDPNLRGGLFKIPGDPEVIVAPTAKEAYELASHLKWTGDERVRFAVFGNGQIEVVTQRDDTRIGEAGHKRNQDLRMKKLVDLVKAQRIRVLRIFKPGRRI
jgi:SAM-dependent methyltransferase